jgi:hypothetical protein
MASIRDDLSTGKRLCVQAGYGEPVVDRLCDLGARYDKGRAVRGDKGLWWLAAARRPQVEALLKEHAEGVRNPPPAAPEDVS